MSDKTTLDNPVHKNPYDINHRSSSDGYLNNTSSYDTGYANIPEYNIDYVYQNIAAHLEQLLKAKNPRPEKAIEAYEFLKSNLTEPNDRANFYKRYPGIVEKMHENLPAEYLQKESSGYEKGHQVSDAELMEKSNLAFGTGNKDLADMYASIAGQKEKEYTPAQPANKKEKNKEKFTDNRVSNTGFGMGIAGDFLFGHGAWSGIKFALGGKNVNLSNFSLKHTEKAMGGSLNGIDVNEKEKIESADIHLDKEKRHLSIGLSSFPINAVNYLTDTFEIRSGAIDLQGIGLVFNWEGTDNPQLVNGNLTLQINDAILHQLRFILSDETYGFTELKTNSLIINMHKLFRFSQGVEDMSNMDFIQELLVGEFPVALQYLVKAIMQVQQHIAPSEDILEQHNTNTDLLDFLSNDISTDTTTKVQWDTLDILNFVRVGQKAEHIGRIHTNAASITTETLQGNEEQERAHLRSLKTTLASKRQDLNTHYKTSLKDQDLNHKAISTLETEIKELNREISILQQKYGLKNTIDVKGLEIEGGDLIGNTYRSSFPEHRVSLGSQPYQLGDINVSSTIGADGTGHSTVSDTIPELILQGPVTYSNADGSLLFMASKGITLSDIRVNAEFEYQEGETKSLQSLFVRIGKVKGQDLMLIRNGESIPIADRDIAGLYIDMNDERTTVGADYADLSGINIPGLLSNNKKLTGEDLYLTLFSQGGYGFGAGSLTAEANIMGTEMNTTITEVAGTYRKDEQGVEHATLNIGYMQLPMLNIHTDSLNISVPQALDELPSSISGVKADVAFKRNEQGLEYVTLNRIDIGSIHAYGLKVSDSKGHQLVDAPQNVLSSFSGAYVSGFKFTIQRDEIGNVKKIQRSVSGEKGEAGIRFDIPEITHYLVRKKLSQDGRNKTTVTGVSGSVDMTQEKNSTQALVSGHVDIGDIELPEFLFNDDSLRISVPSTNARPAALRSVYATFETVLGADNKPVSYKIKDLQAQRLEAYGLHVTQTSGDSKNELKMPADVMAVIEGIELKDVKLDKHFKPKSFEAGASSIDIPEFDAAFKDGSSKASGKLGLTTGKINFKMSDKDHMSMVIENPNLPLFSALSFNDDDANGSLHKPETGGFDFLSADKIEMTIDNKKNTKEIKVHNPVLGEIVVDGTLPEMKDSIEKYQLGIGGKIHGIFLVNVDKNQTTLETWDIKMENASLNLMLKEKAQQKFEDFSKEDQEKREDEFTALDNSLYTPTGDYDFLNAVTAGTVKINLFGQPVEIGVESITDAEGKKEYGYVDLSKAIEEIEGIMGGKVNDQQGKSVDVVEGFKANRAFQNLEADQVDNNYVLQVGPEYLFSEENTILVPDYSKNVKKNKEGKDVVKLSALLDYQMNKPLSKTAKIPDFITEQTERWDKNNLLNLKIELSHLILQPTILNANQSMGLLEKARFIPEATMYGSSLDIDKKSIHTNSLYLNPAEYSPDNSLKISTGTIGLYDFDISFDKTNEIDINVKNLSMDSIKIILKKK